MANQAQATKVVTDIVRFSHVHIFEPYSRDDDDDKSYSMMILIPKSDKATMRKIRAAEEAAADAGVSTKFNGKRPSDLHSIIKDGDESADEYPEQAGHWFMWIKSKTQPGIVDRSRQAILDSTEVYSGCFGRVSINAYPYNYKGKKGVSFGLNHVQKIKDGEFLGGRSRAEDDFDEIDDDEYADDDLI